MNKVVLMGRLTADPEIRSTQNGLKVANFRLAVDRRITKADQKTDFLPCQMWEKKADFAEQWLKKGTKILVAGRIQTGSYDRNGTKVYTTDIIVEDCEFAESKRTEGTPEQDFVPVDADADLPFG